MALTGALCRTLLGSDYRPKPDLRSMPTAPERTDPPDPPKQPVHAAPDGIRIAVFYTPRSTSDEYTTPARLPRAARTAYLTSRSSNDRVHTTRQHVAIPSVLQVPPRQRFGLSKSLGEMRNPVSPEGVTAACSTRTARPPPLPGPGWT